ncbi:MAG: NADH:flavin oxidoreductase/NADH oxidase [Nevskia sp.]|nr:NADH:flavin oxidoreductase/NADH oxidase [Nevskia sp.]
MTSSQSKTPAAPGLFEPGRIAGLQPANRVVVAPMCQYSAKDGVVQPWHAQHLGALAISGAGLLTIEATAVESAGRITHGCVGLWNDAQEQALGRLVEQLRTFSQVPVGIQLAHAGRKGSAMRPWESGRALTAEEGAWQTFSSSELPFGAGWHTPAALDEAGMARVERAFAAAARGVARIGLDFLEIHCAHGYLLHQFLSPVCNQRGDGFGGSRENRMRFPLAVVRAAREAWPAGKTLGARINGTDWIDGGWSLDDAVAFGRLLLDAGVDYLSVSSGGTRAGVTPPLSPGYQVHLAEGVRKALGCPVIAAGLIAEPAHADSIVRGGQADFVGLARCLLDDPRWPIHAAARLGAGPELPPQYRLAAAGKWPLAKTCA